MPVGDVEDDERGARQHEHHGERVDPVLRRLREMGDDHRRGEERKRLETVRLRGVRPRAEALLLLEPEPRIAVVEALAT